MNSSREEFYLKIQGLLDQGLTSKDLALQFLQHFSFANMAGLFLDFDISKSAFEMFSKKLKLTSAEQTQVQKVLKSGVATDLLSILNDKKVSEGTFRAVLVDLASREKPEDLIETLNDHDFNFFEVFRILSSERPSISLLDELKDLDVKKTTAFDLWTIHCTDLSLEEQLTILFTSIFEEKKWARFFSDIGFDKNVHGHLSPKLIVDQIDKSREFSEAIRTILEDVKTNEFATVLKSRALGQSAWFQTVGPNIISVFSGVLHKKVLSLPNREGVKPSSGAVLKFPDFQIVFYRDGTVKAHHVGPDLLTSKKDLVYTINHAYFGYFGKKDTNLLLEEVSQYEKSEKRPSVGTIELKDLAFTPDGLSVTCEWKQKKIKLRWDPGF